MSGVMESSQRLRAAAVEVLAACHGCCTGTALRVLYDEVLEEPVPEEFARLIERLNTID